MSEFEPWNQSYEDGGAPEPQPEPAPAPEAEAGLDPTPAPEAAPETTPEPAPEKKPKRAPRKPKEWSAGKVADARRVFDLLADERSAAAARTLVGVDDPDRLAAAILNGQMRDPASLLVHLHDEQDGVARAVQAIGMLEKDAPLVRRAAQLAAALDASLAEPLKANGMTLAATLAQHAPTLDVEPVRGFVK